MLTGIVAAVLGFLLCVAGHLLAMHRAPAKGRLGAMTRAFALGFPVTLLLVPAVRVLGGGWDGAEHPALAWLVAILLHILLFFLFVECFYHIERSVTLRLLVELLEHPQGAATAAEIMRDYSVDDMIRRRLDDLVRNGWIGEGEGRYRLTAKGAGLARVMRASIWLYQSKPQNERL
jgi:DNA-binding HxlR family transcriptional regulator